MGNFEKLGILVIIVLVVTILVLTFWGMNIPPAEVEAPPAALSGQAPANVGGGGAHSAPAPEPVRPPPAAWPPKPVEPKPLDPKPVEPKPEEPKPVETEPVVPKPVPAKDLEHQVKKGESLYAISRLYYGDGKYWKEIAQANPEISAENLPAGAKLRIPAPEKVLGTADPRPAPVPVPVPVAAGRTYRVEKNDSLFTISADKLGSGNRWRELYDTNRNVIGPNPDRLAEGMVLVLPD